MLEVTDRAAAALDGVLAVNKARPEDAIRLVVSGPGSIGMTIDAPKEGDEIVRYEDRPVLVLSDEIASALDGTVLDYQEAVPDGSESGTQQGGFTLTRAEE